MPGTASARRSAYLTAALLPVLLAGCAGTSAATGQSTTGLSGSITTGGSSTTGPLTKAIGARFRAYNPGVGVETQITSTGEGLAAFCEGRLDIANASRGIEDPEKRACADKGVEYVEFLVANDGITLVVNKRNTWATCLTTAQLKAMWSAAPAAKTWRDVDGAYPAEPLTLFGPDRTSGTFEVLATQVVGGMAKMRTDYAAAQDDNLTVKGVTDNRSAAGFFGYSYYVDNEDLLKRVSIDSGRGCVTPNPTTIRDGSYAPLSRPLLIYVNKARLTAQPQLKAIVRYYLEWTPSIAVDVNVVPLTRSQTDKDAQRLQTIG